MTLLERTYGIGQGYSPEGREIERRRHSEARLGAAHKHTWGPQSWDGYAYCDCGRRIECRFDLPPIDIGAAHVLADIKGHGLRSTR